MTRYTCPESLFGFDPTYTHNKFLTTSGREIFVGSAGAPHSSIVREDGIDESTIIDGGLLFNIPILGGLIVEGESTSYKVPVGEDNRQVTLDVLAEITPDQKITAGNFHPFRSGERK